MLLHRTHTFIKRRPALADSLSLSLASPFAPLPLHDLSEPEAPHDPCTMEGMLNYFIPEDGDSSDHLNVVPLPRVDQLRLQHIKKVSPDALVVCLTRPALAGHHLTTRACVCVNACRSFLCPASSTSASRRPSKALSVRYMSWCVCTSLVADAVLCVGRLLAH